MGTLADEITRQAFLRLTARELIDPSPSDTSKHFRYLGIRSALLNCTIGNTAHGRRLKTRQAQLIRWKPYNRMKYESVYPFRLREDCR